MQESLLVLGGVLGWSDNLQRLNLLLHESVRNHSYFHQLLILGQYRSHLGKVLWPSLIQSLGSCLTFETLLLSLHLGTVDVEFVSPFAFELSLIEAQNDRRIEGLCSQELRRQAQDEKLSRAA